MSDLIDRLDRLPWLGALPPLALDPLRYLDRRIGQRPYARVRLGPYRALIVNDAAGVQEALVDRQHELTAITPVRKSMRRLFGNSLLTTDGASWLQQRRLIQPAFHRRHLADWARIMTAEAEVTLDKWRRKGAHNADITEEMMALALRVVNQALFGVDCSAYMPEVSRVMKVILEAIWRTRRLPLPIPAFIPTPVNRMFADSRARLERIVHDFIAAGRHRAGGSDLLSLLITARDADTGERMSERQVRDELITFFLAGHETTASALIWTWFSLAENPHVEARLRQELDEKLAGRPPEFADLAHLPYLEQVVKESMRIYPPAWSMARSALRRTSVGGHAVDRGTLVLMFPYLLHRSPRYWHDPLRFDPERFAAASEQGRPKFAYFPFGGGPRQCPGNMFAFYEVQLVVATLLQGAQVRRASLGPVPVMSSVTMRPRDGLAMTITPLLGRLT